MLNEKEQNLIKCAKQFNITDKSELEDLLAQCNHESANFTRTVESFNYTPDGLIATWPKRFTPELANALGRTLSHPANQQAIANHVYNGRMGNIINSNDGYIYRGRGYLQCTGRDNYTALNKWLKENKYNYDVLVKPDIVATNLLTISAIWFWITNNIEKFALKDDLVAVTKKINGGLNGLDNRKQLTNYYKQEFNINI
jgi:putative chitinase